ncbi:SDR family NAD(P)-dependent oxidoreductase [Streptomyces monashensis]|uniref:SDR family NAD(P)-dependent oxidoreductase n=1 Tax=Streptomyces monashensis TaxID=1678012 RepID=UPI0033E7CB9F
MVTGAGRGLGQAIAQRLSKDGYRLVLSDIEGEPVRQTAAALGSGHIAMTVDVSRPDGPETLAAVAQDQFGRLDVWINNAGIIPCGQLDTHDAPVLSYTWAVNLGGVVHGSRAAVGLMRRQRHGHLVNIASVLAVRPLAGFAVYSATKAGVLAFSDSMRRELRRDGIKVTTILPYMATTPMAAGIQPRILPATTPQRVADAVAQALRRPRPHVYVPRICRLLPWGNMLPPWARDLTDNLLGLDHIGLDVDIAARAPYDAMLRKRSAAHQSR